MIDFWIIYTISMHMLHVKWDREM